MTDELDAIIAGLTEAQREWLTTQHWCLARPLSEFIPMRLARRTDETEWPYWAELTPLGLAVRERLMEKNNAG